MVPAQRPRLPDSEKITVNIGFVDLGHIDLMVRESFFANRTDFIRTAIRRELDRHRESLSGSLHRAAPDLGLRFVSRADLEQAVERGQKLDLNVLGLLTLAADIPPDLAHAAIGRITVLGAFHASPAIRAALSDRIF